MALTKDDYENLIYEHDFQKDAMNKALETVCNFIQRKNRILVGGMAIDIALRSKGSKLYKDDQFPDYDFISPEFHKDAYELGDILSKDFAGISCIMAFHTSTMKVRLNFQEVADITYVPPNIYDIIPTITHMNFRVVHPHFQMIDQHRALSLPYEKPPLETVFGRWKKDIQRYDILNEKFPIKQEPTNGPIDKTTVCYKIPLKVVKEQCLSGYMAMLYWINKVSSDGLTVFKTGDSPKWLMSFTITKDDFITCELPTQAELTFLTDVPETLLKQIQALYKKNPSKVSKINPVLDKTPSIYLFEEKKDKQARIKILNNRGNKIGAHLDGNFYVSNLQEIMCYLSTQGVLYKSDVALMCYELMQKILFYAAEKYAKTKDEKWLVYLPTTSTYGKYNEYDAYDVAKENIEALMNKKQKTLLTPRNAFPTAEAPVKLELFKFVPSSSPLYQYNGLVL